MTPDQIARLTAIQTRLIDVFEAECDTTAWPGHGLSPGSMDRDTRGDRYWCKKNAAATLALVARLQSLAAYRPAAPFGSQGEEGGEGEPEPVTADPGVDVEGEIAKFERQAAAAIERAQARRK